MDKVFGIDNDTWAAVSAIGSVLGAIGTLTAVIVALRLARRDLYPRLDITNAIMQTAEPDPASAAPAQFMTISGTNIGHTVATVKGIFWTIGWFRKRVLITVPYDNPYSTRLPKEITHGQQVLLMQPLDEFKKYLAPFIRAAKERWTGRFAIRSLRVGLYTSVGIDFTCRADARIRALLSAAYDASTSKAHNR